MRLRTRWMTTLAVAGALLLGAPYAAHSQEAEESHFDVDSLAVRMQLEAEGRAQLEELGGLLERRHEIRSQARKLRSEMAELMRSLHQNLDPEARKELKRTMHHQMRRPTHRGSRGHGGRSRCTARHGSMPADSFSQGHMKSGGGHQGGMHADSAGHHPGGSEHPASHSEAHGHGGAGSGHGSEARHGQGRPMHGHCERSVETDGAVRDTAS